MLSHKSQKESSGVDDGGYSTVTGPKVRQRTVRYSRHGSDE